MRFFRQKWLKKRINTACSAIFAALFSLGALAQQPSAPVDPQPPRIADLPALAPQRAAPRAAPPPKPAAPPPAPTLEQSLTPDTKPPAADPKQRALDNLNRSLQQQRNQAARDQGGASGAPRKIDRVEVEAARPEQRDEVKAAFDRHLPPPKKSGLEQVVLDNGARCTIDHDCVGPFCAAACTGTKETLGNQKAPGGMSLR